ncbi:MAG: N-acetyl-gamma-glutamyl-phosphate reductase [Bacteroidetes bacterium]|nr:N-acetyl-gamma-glutamyl-phosphate reductase [Bacteroidota bacterium]
MHSLNKIRVGIIGGAGYTGGELIRLLIHHPNAVIQFVQSNSQAGKPISSIHADLVGDAEWCFTRELSLNDIDLLFLCLAHGDAKIFLGQHDIPASVKIIDLSNDHRATASNPVPEYHGIKFVYGLPEVNKTLIQSAQYVANPGCFATAIQLGLLPLAKAGILGDVYTTGITGSTGAGAGMSDTSHFSWRANNIQAYKTLSHQHVPEVCFTLNASKPTEHKSETNLNFIPWRGDFTRGIFISSQLKCDLSLEELQQLYISYYEEHPFTNVISRSLFLKQVVNTNKCLIQLEKVGHQLVIHSAIDNLLKGASGQAVQNMNLMFGLEETTGLQLKANFF